ncbi:transposable element Tcb1 transposase [Trichonephila clavipes]|nr:transposable element Tcb1 transposase [Trichonephila clavipes]
MTGNTLPGLTRLFSNGIELMDVYGYEKNHKNPWTLYVQQGTVQAGGSSLLIWCVHSWRDMESPPIRLDTTLTSNRYVSILSDHLHPFMSIVHSNGLGEFQQGNAIPPTGPELLQRGSMEFRIFLLPPKFPIYEHY